MEEMENNLEDFNKLEQRVKDSNGIEYCLIFQTLTDKIEITCTQIDDEEIIYYTNINFDDIKNKHKYLKGAEVPEEILEGLNEFLDTIKIIKEGNKMKIIFTIVYLKKKDQVIFELSKKELFSDDEEDDNEENSDKKILKLQKKIEVLTLSNKDLNKKVTNLVSINNDLIQKFDFYQNKIEQMGNIIQNLNKNIENLTSSLNKKNNQKKIEKNKKEINIKDSNKDLSEENEINSETENNDLLNNNQMKEKIEDYHEEKIISSNNYNYCFIQLKNNNIAIGFNSGIIGIYESKNFIELFHINAHSKDIRCILELSNGYIASCSNDNNIIINKINYEHKSNEEIQKIKNNSCVYKLIEINEQFLISCDCENIDIWIKNDENKYDNYKSMQIGKNIYGLLQLNEKLFCAHIAMKTLHFYNIEDFSLVKELDNIPTRLYNNLCIINKEILCIGTTEQIFLISISKMEIIKSVNVDKCGIESLTFLPNNTLLTGVTIGVNNLPLYSFIQFKLNDDNNDLIEISRKDKVHGWTIYDLKCIVVNGQYKIASSGSMDCKIKIWG